MISTEELIDDYINVSPLHFIDELVGETKQQQYKIEQEQLKS